MNRNELNEMELDMVSGGFYGGDTNDEEYKALEMQLQGKTLPVL